MKWPCEVQASRARRVEGLGPRYPGVPSLTGSAGAWPRRVASAHPLAPREHATSGLDLGTGTPTGDKGTRKGRVAEIDRQGIVQHTTCARRCHRPSGCAALLVEPTLDPVEPGAQPLRGNPDPYTHGEASFR